ncbi:MAG: hypothetical protein JNL58_28670 [Planctomyces sp.]|nr:hypothetical protein [Planctomyces sp.]
MNHRKLLKLAHAILLTGSLMLSGLMIGCQGLETNSSQKYVEPALPMSLSREELIAHINRHTRGLESWQCMDTQIRIRLPNGLRQRLSGSLACEAPSNFRLTARNAIANADLGTNNDICWFYMKPGDIPLMMWRHDDAELLDQVQLGFPRVDPRWLMNVLGVVPLAAEDFTLSHGPAGSKELWLQAIDEKPNGEAARRAIKVDTISGHVREHVIYDRDRNPVVRANLKDYKTVQGNVLPTQISLEFPMLDMEIALTFSRIDPNSTAPKSLWTMPNGADHVVNLGDEIRKKVGPGQIALGRPEPLPYHEQGYQSHTQDSPFFPPHDQQMSGDEFANDGPGLPEPPIDSDEFSQNDRYAETPQWDTPPPRSSQANTSGQKKKFRWWPWGRG